MIVRLRILLLTSSVALMTACGGGGGGSSSSAAAPSGSSGQTSTGTASGSSSSSSSTTGSSSSSSSTSTDSSSSDNDTTSDSTADFNIPAMLTDIADKVIIPNYESLATAATAFAADASSLATYCGAIGSADEASALGAAQTEWLDVMAKIQLTEPHAVGPAGANDDTLRNRVLSYANVDLNTCGLDQSVAQQSSADFNLSTRSSNQRGFGAIEYLLYNTTLTHSCAPQISATSEWNDLSETERKTQRCTYAQSLATDVADAATTIANEWSAAGGNYRASFVAEDSAGTSLQALTDVVIVHMDKEAKDRKIGIPTGVKAECSSYSCADLIESPYSETSLTNIRNNLIGFREVFNGGDGVGFDDLINDADFADITSSVQTKIADAITNIDAASVSLNDQATAITDETTASACTNAYGSPDTSSTDYSACSLTGLLKRITDVLKIEFVNIVGVNLPGSVQSDND
jgi:predicted lipoprotein